MVHRLKTQSALGSRPNTHHPLSSYNDKQQKTQLCRVCIKDSYSTVLLLLSLSCFFIFCILKLDDYSIIFKLFYPVPYINILGY